MATVLKAAGAWVRRPKIRNGLASRRSFLLLLLIPTVAAAVLVFQDIGRLPFWNDEVWSMNVADRSIPGTVEVLDNEANMTLYYLLLNGWTELGSGEAFVRSLGAVFAIAAVPVTMLFARRAFGLPAAAIAGATLALSDLLVVYGQEARSYALVLLLAPLCFFFFLRAIQSGRAREWVAYTLTAAALVYAQLLGVLFVVAQFASLPLLPAVRVRWRYAARSLVGLAALCLPLLVLIVFGDQRAPSWIDPISLLELGDIASRYAGGSLLLIVFGILFALVAHQFVVALRRSGRSQEAWIRGLILLWIVLPPVLLLAMSAVESLFVARYVIGILPGIAVMAGAAIAGLRPRGLAFAGAAFLIAAMLGHVATREKPPQKHDLRAAASLVVSKAHPGDGVAYSPPQSRIGFSYYLDGVSPSGRSALRDLGMKPGGTPLRTGDVFAEEATAGAVARRIKSSDRVWLVGLARGEWNISRDPVAEVGPAILRRHFVRRGTWNFGVKVTLYERRAGSRTSGSPH